MLRSCCAGSRSSLCFAGPVRFEHVDRGAERSRARDVPPGLMLPQPVQTYVFWRCPYTYLARGQARLGSRFTLDAACHPPLVFLSAVYEIAAMFAAPVDMVDAGPGAKVVEPLIGETSFMRGGAECHAAIRRALTPALRRGTVTEHAEEIADVAREAIAAWPTNRVVPLDRRIQAIVLDVITRAVFGRGDQCPSPSRTCLQAMLSIAASPLLAVELLRHGPGRREWARFLRRRAEVDRILYRIIDVRRASGGVGDDLLGRLLAARNPDGSPLSRRQVRDNTMTMLVSGHETTAAQLAWAFQLLAHNPRVQERLIEEIDGGADDAYLTATVQEVLRHRPVFLFAIPRAVVRPLEIGGFTYRPPAQLLACIHLLHHDPALYEDADTFRPERFLDAPPDPRAWMPWGGGRKRCPGMHLATLEMKTILRVVLTRFTVHPVGRRMERPRWRSVIVTPHRGCRVVLRSRVEKVGD